jgi:hypothetical protein
MEKINTKVSYDTNCFADTTNYYREGPGVVSLVRLKISVFGIWNLSCSISFWVYH